MVAVSTIDKDNWLDGYKFWRRQPSSENAPTVEFIHAGERSFTRPGKFQAAISSFDSLNHVMRLDELKTVFRNVCAALDAGVEGPTVKSG